LWTGCIAPIKLLLQVYPERSEGLFSITEFLLAMKRIILIISFYLIGYSNMVAQFVSETKHPNSISLTGAVIYVDENDFTLVKKSAELLQQDIEMVTGKKLQLVNKFPSSSIAIIIGSLQKSSGISKLLKQKKINAKNISGKWEAYQLQSLPNALVIEGSDRRGTAYGVFEFSKQIGVSPWYWWADVPVKKKKEIFVNTNVFITDAPKVKYSRNFY
jgi:hypothetical protein